MRPSQLLSVALLSSTISAWSLHDSLADSKAMQGIENLFRRADEHIFRRADSSSSSNPNAPTSTMSTAKSSTEGSEASSTESSAETTTDSSDSSATSGTTKASSGSKSSSGTAKTTSKASTGKSSGSSATVTSTTSYNNSVGYGGVSMISPDPQSSSSYYKIGNYITFAWNLTSLSITPTAIDILASCTANQNTYTIAMNQTVNGSEGAVTWDTGDYQSTGTIPLLTETYTLIIHDAARDVTATAPYGGMSAYSAFKFAMYTKQPYTAMADGWKCVTCNGAMSQSERQTLGVVFGVAGLTILSFTYFAGNFGVF